MAQISFRQNNWGKDVAQTRTPLKAQIHLILAQNLGFFHLISVTLSNFVWRYARIISAFKGATFMGHYFPNCVVRIQLMPSGYVKGGSHMVRVVTA